MVDLLAEALEVEELHMAVPGLSTVEGHDDIADLRARARRVTSQVVCGRAAVRADARLNDIICRRSEDGLLDHLIDASDPVLGTDDRATGLHHLATYLRDRRLFESLAVCSDSVDADYVWRLWGSSAERRRLLERSIARFAAIDCAWQILVWIPPPERAKPPLQLFADRARSAARAGQEAGRHPRSMNEAPAACWSVRVFTDPWLRREHPDRAAAAVARIAELLQLTRWDDPGVPTATRKLAVDQVATEEKLTIDATKQLECAAPAFWNGPASAREDVTYARMVEEVRLTLHGGRDGTAFRTARLDVHSEDEDGAQSQLT